MGLAIARVLGLEAMAGSVVYDVIVVGAGVEGSATAYQLIINGAKRVLLLEQVLHVYNHRLHSLPYSL